MSSPRTSDHSSNASSFEQKLKRLRWAWVLVLGLFAVFFAIVGMSLLSSAVYLHEYQAAFVLVVFFIIAAVLAASPITVIRIIGIWTGIFLIAQLFIPDIKLGKRHIHLIPNSVKYIDVVTGIRGIEGLQIITTDAEGFRAVPPIDYTKKTRFRIVAIGGSTTEDIYVDDRRTWTHRLQENLNAAGMDVEVINAGVAARLSTHHLETLKYVARFDPDMAVFLVGINDWSRFTRRYRMGYHWDIGIRPTKFLLLKAIKNGKRIYRSQKQVKSQPPPPDTFPMQADGVTPDIPPEFITIVSRPWPKGRQPNAAKPAFRPDSVARKYEETMLEISKVCHAHGIICMFMTQPSRIHADAAPRDQRGSKHLEFETRLWIKNLYNDFLLKFANENGHIPCDLATQVPRTDEALFDEVHFNTSGTKIVAAVAAQCILSSLNKAAPGQ